VKWLGGILQQKCLGIFDDAFSPFALSSILPDESANWSLDSTLWTWLPNSLEAFPLVAASLDAPPPR
jgi:hypothetical protein